VKTLMPILEKLEGYGWLLVRTAKAGSQPRFLVNQIVHQRFTTRAAVVRSKTWQDTAGVSGLAEGVGGSVCGEQE